MQSAAQGASCTAKVCHGVRQALLPHLTVPALPWARRVLEDVETRGDFSGHRAVPCRHKLCVRCRQGACAVASRFMAAFRAAGLALFWCRLPLRSTASL